MERNAVATAAMTMLNDQSVAVRFAVGRVYRNKKYGLTHMSHSPRSTIPKSGNRFSAKTMLKQQLKAPQRQRPGQHGADTGECGDSEKGGAEGLADLGMNDGLLRRR
jgi:hypothetical protein